MLGPDFVTDDPGNPHPDTSLDCYGHGTQVAGVLGGATYGVAKNVTLVAVRVLNCSGVGSSIDLISAIDWVTQDHTANFVPAVAKSQPHHHCRSGELHRDRRRGLQLDRERRRVGARGRQSLRRRRQLLAGATAGGDHGRRDLYLCRQLRVRAGYSNTGPEVDLYAPGVAITSAYFTGDYAAAECSVRRWPRRRSRASSRASCSSIWWAPPGHVYSQVVYQNATPGVVYDAGVYTPNRLLYSGFMDQ